jgi:hypothetical protein
MKLFVAIVGLFILFATLWEAFETIILPRRVTRRLRLVRIFYRVTWTFWASVNRTFRTKKMREAHLSYYGPLSLLALFATWAFLLILAFAMLHWAAGSAINAPGETPTFRTDFYLSGTTFFTLGLGDVTPRTTLAKAITVTEGGTGFGFLGLMISYLPTPDLLPPPPNCCAGTRILRTARCSFPSFAIGKYGRRNSWRAISPIRCSVIFVRSMTINPGSRHLPPSSMCALCSSPTARARPSGNRD